ncbi:MAG: hypothetical protein ACM3N9_00845 [Syntrophothermus sp.]
MKAKNILTLLFLSFCYFQGFAQCDTTREFGITLGGFTNFPANKDYLDKYMSGFYVAPFFKTGKHEFSLGADMPLATKAIYFSDEKINPMPGVVAGYKYYFADIYGREQFFIHYMWQYMRYKKDYTITPETAVDDGKRTETDFYINNVIGLGYNLFIDMDNRFGFYYILDYMISQKNFKLNRPENNTDEWISKFSWNNISTQIGFSFRLAKK